MELVANAANDLLGAFDATARVPERRRQPGAGREAPASHGRPAWPSSSWPCRCWPWRSTSSAGLRRARVPLAPGRPRGRPAGAAAPRGPRGRLPAVPGRAAAAPVGRGAAAPGRGPLRRGGRPGAWWSPSAPACSASVWTPPPRPPPGRPAVLRGHGGPGVPGVVLVLLWIVSPFALVLALPAAHAAAVRRRGAAPVAARRPGRRGPAADPGPGAEHVAATSTPTRSSPPGTWWSPPRAARAGRWARSRRPLVVACVWSMALRRRCSAPARARAAPAPRRRVAPAPRL